MSNEATQRVLEHAREGVTLREEFFEQKAELLVEVGRMLAITLARGNRIYLCGNGGSAADCQHIAAEFVNRFQLERPPLPALALTTDTSALTAIGNDYGFEQVFEKQVQAFGMAGDCLMGLSTSGNSPNVVAAMKVARARQMTCVGLTGQGGGEMMQYCDYLLAVGHKRTALVQEVHIAASHTLCDLVDYFLFEAVSELQPYLG